MPGPYVAELHPISSVKPSQKRQLLQQPGFNSLFSPFNTKKNIGSAGVFRRSGLISSLGLNGSADGKIASWFLSRLCLELIQFCVTGVHYLSS